MQITYLGHSAFSLKGKNGIVVTDPFSSDMGLKMPKVSADFITISHDHSDHNAIDKVSPTTRRERPFVIDAPGEYEVAGVSVFGFSTFHDNSGGSERGRNIIYTIHLDDLVVCHLGDLGHTLDEKTIEKLGVVDVLLCPVGGKFTIDPKTAVEVIQAIEPSYVIPMHYKTEKIKLDIDEVSKFCKEMGAKCEPQDKLIINKQTQAEEQGEEVVVLKVK